jgi:hypothetical protein
LPGALEGAVGRPGGPVAGPFLELGARCARNEPSRSPTPPPAEAELLCIKEWTVTVRQEPRYSVAAMATLLDDLDAFYLEHRRCGALDTGVEGERVWMMCYGCGAGLSRSLLRALIDSRP